MDQNYGNQDCYCNESGTPLLFFHAIFIEKKNREKKIKLLTENLSIETAFGTKPLTPETETKYRKEIEELKEHMGFYQRIQILASWGNTNPNDFKELLQPPLTADDPGGIGLGLEVIINKCIEHNNIEDAKEILTHFIQELNRLPSIEAIERWESPELAKWMHEKYGNHSRYADNISELESLAGRIEEKNIQTRIKKLEDNLSTATEYGTKPLNPEAEIKYRKELDALKEHISMSQRIQILAAWGNTNPDDFKALLPSF